LINKEKEELRKEAKHIAEEIENISRLLKDECDSLN